MFKTGGDDGDRRVVVALVAATALALLARLVALDARVAHWDEARVSYWTLQYLDTGWWQYQPIVHGPFLFHVNRLVFDYLGATDATMRLAVAVVGGLAPLSAWLYRDHLRAAETVALGAILAADPLFLFFSRFARNDPLLAAFAFAGLGFFLRARSTGRSRYLVAAGLAIGLGFTTKENAVLYVLCWLGAAALVAAVARREAGGGPTEIARGLVDDAAEELNRFPGPGVVAAGVAWMATVVAFYAPRTATAGADAVGLWNAFDHPGVAPAVLRAATVGAAGRLVDVWIGGGHQSLGFRTAFYLVHEVAILAVGSGGLCLLALWGFRVERRGDGPRPLVAFAGAWAGLSVAGYPLVADMAAPWLALHAAVALSIPAAVGLADAVESARRRSQIPGGDGGARAPRRSDREETGGPDVRRAGLAALVVALATAQAVAVGGATSYAAPDSALDPLAQPAQPPGELRETARDLAAVACGPEPSALYVGPYFAPRHGHRRLPLRWYLARDGIGTAHVRSAADLPADPPPVVVALDARRDELDGALSGYRVRTHEFDTWVLREPAGPFSEVAVYVDRDAVERGRDRCGDGPSSSEG
jgi:uncharacterized protein (TIGR03663 family)